MASLLVLSLAACGTHFVGSDTDSEPPCTPYPWFLDADSDGLGDPNTTSIVQCNPDDATGFTASNNVDCDDGDPSITAAGPSCPADIAGSAAFTQYSIGSREYLVTFPPPEDPTNGSGVISMDVDEICSGWGGAPFVANSDQEIVALNEHVPYDLWAGWVGVVAGVDGWAWDDGDAIVDFCDGDGTVPEHDTIIHLAWVKRDLIEDPLGTCIGLPDHVFGVYTDDVVTSTDSDGDGLEDADDPNPTVFDSDGDGVGDGQEVDVVGTDPESQDPFPVLEPVEDPQLAYQANLAFFACERELPAP